jgi:hypothetical protein
MLVTMTHNQVEALLEERIRTLTKTYTKNRKT